MALIDLLLADDVEGFNAARGRRSSPALGASDLSGRRLPGVDLTHADLENADLRGSDLHGAVLLQAHLDGADLTGADLRGVMGHRSRWRGAFLGQARLEGAELPRADLSDAELPEVEGEGLDLTGARLKGADLTRARLPGADLSDAQLGGAKLAEAVLAGARLRAAQLPKADLTGADLSGADLTEARLPGAVAVGANLSGAVLVGADLTGADLTRADLRGADLTRADLGGARLEGALLEGALVREARLDGSDLGKATLVGAVMDDASLGAPPEVDETPPQGLLFEDLSGCVSGGAVALLWENQDAPGRARLRVAVATLDGAWDGRAPAIPEPADLVVARGLVPGALGFLAVLFVQRPGGMVCRVTEISPQGDIGATRSLPCEVQPAVRPVFYQGADSPLLAVLGRRGPSVHVLALGEAGLATRARQVLPTARGFVDGVHPAVLCKGGVVMPVDERGLGAAVSVPEGFPGRLSTAGRCGAALFLAWTPASGRGLEWAALEPGRPARGGLLARNAAVGSLDCVAWRDRTLLVWTEDGAGPEEGTRLRGAVLPDGAPFALLPDALHDPDQVRVLAAGEPVLASVVDGGGAACVIEIRPGEARVVARLG